MLSAARALGADGRGGPARAGTGGRALRRVCAPLPHMDDRRLFSARRPALWPTGGRRGCAVVEMECAALAACAGFHGVQFAQLLYTADSLAAAGHSDRGWGEASVHSALALVLHAASLL